MGDNKPLRPDLEPSAGWPEHPDDQERQPSEVTQAWAAEANARLSATEAWAEGALRAGAERRLKVGEASALPALERRNWTQEVERLREELERMRANRDRWRKRAETAEASLAELENEGG